MRKACVFVNGKRAAVLLEYSKESFELIYDDNYSGPPVSLTLPTKNKSHKFSSFPTFFEGLLPEGIMLEMLLRTKKIDRYDHFIQLLAVGSDLVGGITVQELP